MYINKIIASNKIHTLNLIIVFYTVSNNADKICMTVPFYCFVGNVDYLLLMFGLKEKVILIEGNI